MAWKMSLLIRLPAVKAQPFSSKYTRNQSIAQFISEDQIFIVFAFWLVLWDGRFAFLGGRYSRTGLRNLARVVGCIVLLFLLGGNFIAFQ